MMHFGHSATKTMPFEVALSVNASILVDRIAGPNSVLFAYLAETHDDKHRGMAIMGNGMAFAFVQVLQPGEGSCPVN